MEVSFIIDMASECLGLDKLVDECFSKHIFGVVLSFHIASNLPWSGLTVVLMSGLGSQQYMVV